MAFADVRNNYPRHGFAAPLPGLQGQELRLAQEGFERFQSLHRERLYDFLTVHEMNHAWLPWLRHVAKLATIASAVEEAFRTRNFCLYATDILADTLPEARTDSHTFSPLLKPVDRQHFVSAVLAIVGDVKLKLLPTAAGGKTEGVELDVRLRPGEFCLCGPSTRYQFLTAHCVLLRYVRASTVEQHAEVLGKELMLPISGFSKDLAEMPELPGEATEDGWALRHKMQQRRAKGYIAAEIAKGKKGLKCAEVDPSQYTLKGLLNYGTTCTVHIATFEGKVVIVKRVREPWEKLEVQRHFLEARALSSLQHPNIIQLWGCANNLGQLDLLIEHCGDGCLTEYAQKGLASCGRAVEIMCELISAVAYMHGESFAHLDIKPDNCLVAAGRCKLGDFGSAARMDASGAVNTRWVGTRGYRAPELEMKLPCDGRKADVWSFARVGEFLEQFFVGTWFGMTSLTSVDPDDRPAAITCLQKYRQLQGLGAKPP